MGRKDLVVAGFVFTLYLTERFTSEVGVRTNYYGFFPVLASTRLWMLVLTLF